MIIIEIAGHLGADVETRFTPDGTKVSTLRVAVNLKKGNKEETVWWRVSLWGERWDKILPYLKKGSGVIIIGEMNKPEIYNDRDGQPQVRLDIRGEIVRFSPFGRTGERSGQEQQHQQTTQKPWVEESAAPGNEQFAGASKHQTDFTQSPQAGRGVSRDIADEDLPF